MVLIKQSCNAVAAAWESKKFAWQGFNVGNEILQLIGLKIEPFIMSVQSNKTKEIIKKK